MPENRTGWGKGRDVGAHDALEGSTKKKEGRMMIDDDDDDDAVEVDEEVKAVDPKDLKNANVADLPVEMV